MLLGVKWGSWSTNQARILRSFPGYVGSIYSNKLSKHAVLFQAQAELDEAKEIFDTMNDQLIAELPQLLDLRVPYFDPSFEAMIRMQCKFAEEGYEKLGGVQR